MVLVFRVSRNTSGLCGQFGNKLFTATVVRARRKNAGIAGPTSNFSNAAMAAVASIRVNELSKQPTRHDCIFRVDSYRKQAEMH